MLMFMCLAVHKLTRNSLRFSSSHEPSDPPLRVIFQTLASCARRSAPYDGRLRSWHARTLMPFVHAHRPEPVQCIRAARHPLWNRRAPFGRRITQRTALTNVKPLRSGDRISLRGYILFMPSTSVVLFGERTTGENRPTPAETCLGLCRTQCGANSRRSIVPCLRTEVRRRYPPQICLVVATRP